MCDPEQTSTTFLDREVLAALSALDASAREAEQANPLGERSLEQARLPLLRLRDYYLPLLHAREAAHGALCWHHRGDREHTLESLNDAETTLLVVSDRVDAQVAGELEAPIEMVVEAIAASRADRPEAAELVRSLARRINLLLLKSELALRNSELERR